MISQHEIIKCCSDKKEELIREAVSPFAERNIIKPFRQQFGVERSEWGPKLRKKREALAPTVKKTARPASEGKFACDSDGPLP